MRQLSYKVQIGSEVFDSKGQALLSFSVDRDMNVPADSFLLGLKPGEWAKKIKNGDPVVLEFGYGDALNKVLAGSVDSVEAQVSEVLVRGLGGISFLTSLYPNQFYEKQSAGAIVRDLAERAGLKVKEADEGISYPSFVVDESKNAYTHLKVLAIRNRCDLYLTGDGQLIFQRYKPADRPKVLKYGRDIISCEIAAPAISDVTVKVRGESPSSFKGTESSHLKTKKVIEGSAGKGSRIIVIDDPTVKDQDSANKAAAAYLESILIPLKGTLNIVGNSGIDLGNTIEIQGMPNEQLNGQFKITRVFHQLGMEGGFTTQVEWIKTVTVTPGEPPLVESRPPEPPKPPSPLEEQLDNAKKELEQVRQELQDAVEEGEEALAKLFADVMRQVDEVAKKAEDLLAAADEAKKAALETADEALAKADDLQKELEKQKKEMLAPLEEAKAASEEYQKEAEKKIEDKEKALQEAREKAEKATERPPPERPTGEGEGSRQEGGEISQTREGKRPEEKDKKESSREKGVEEEKAKAEEQIKGLEQDLEETKKDLKEAKKKLQEQVEPVEKQVEDLEKEANAQIDELTATAKKIRQEAEDTFNQATKDVEAGKREVEGMMNELKAAYEKARETVVQARKTAGLE